MNRDFLSCDWGTTSFRLRRVAGPERAVIREIREQAGVKSLYEEAMRGGAELEAARADVFARFLNRKVEPIVGILRGFTLGQMTEIVRAALRGGLRNIEITMNSPDAARQLREAVAVAEGRLNIGAGTVMNLELLDQALAAGAAFVVTPTLDPEVIAECANQKIPVFPGAFSPTEIVRAWELGAMMVKVFPAECVGPGYIRALKAPLPHIKLLPTGGVDLKTLPDFLKAGADGFGIGGPLFDRQRVESCDWTWVEAQCRAFAETYRQAS